MVLVRKILWHGVEWGEIGAWRWGLRYHLLLANHGWERYVCVNSKARLSARAGVSVTSTLSPRIKPTQISQPFLSTRSKGLLATRSILASKRTDQRQLLHPTNHKLFPPPYHNLGTLGLPRTLSPNMAFIRMLLLSIAYLLVFVACVTAVSFIWVYRIMVARKRARNAALLMSQTEEKDLDDEVVAQEEIVTEEDDAQEEGDKLSWDEMVSQEESHRSRWND